MSKPFDEQFDVFTHHATESEVVLAVGDMSQGRVRAFSGELRGPRCIKAKTLPASFRVGRIECDPKIVQYASVLVTEPCYWSPELPMLYDLDLNLELADGTTTRWRHTLGLRRTEIHGRDLFRGGKRIVLRGVATENITEEALESAEQAELVLLAKEPNSELIARASEMGVPVVIDLRGFTGDITPKLLSYFWQPAVELVFLDTQSTSAHFKPTALKIGCVVGSEEPPATALGWADLLCFGLSGGDSPPVWASTLAKPIIAIQESAAYAELTAARAGCDRLQARLAPAWDLAGYFV